MSITETVTWIHVERPTLDILGVLISSLMITVFLAMVAVVAGTLAALGLIRWRSRHELEPGAHLVRLRLSSREP